MRILCTIFILLGVYSNSEAANIDSTLYLIPQPKNVKVRSGVFDFSRQWSIIARTDTFCSQQLRRAVVKKFNMPSANTSGVNTIYLLKVSGPEFEKVVSDEKLNPPFVLGNEGYILDILPNRIVVVANENAGIFYGVQTLIQIINANSKGSTIPCMIIYDKPDMEMRGWQDDISRGPIPTLDFLKEEIRRMSSFKLNTFTLYTEHVFKLKKHPAIAPPHGISGEEIKELVRFAKNYNVDIIGNFQSFGHFKNILKVKGYERLGENENTLSPAKEESYEFLSDVYSEVVSAYDSKYFHINCDEVFLGNGTIKTMIDSVGVDGIYANHINRIDSLLKPYRKRIMMWGDIAVHNPKIISRLPKDMIIVSWGYAPMESNDEEILPFVKSGFEFIVAPGVSCWNRIYPDMNRATINIYNYLRDGYKNNCIGFINTTWDDDGQNLFNNNWYGLIWGADCGWNAPVNEAMKESEETRKSRTASFNRSYNKVYFETDADITSLLFAISDLRNGAVKNSLSNESIWNAILPDYNIIPENYEQDNLNLINTIDSLLAVADKFKPYFTGRETEFNLLPFALKQARLVVNKNLLGIKLKQYVQADTLMGISSLQYYFKTLTDTVQKLKTDYGKLWKLENRNWWLDTVYFYYSSFPQKLSEIKGVCIIKASDKLIHGKREIRLRSAYNNLPVYYTSDGTEPTLSSLKYTGPIYTDSNIYIRARVIEEKMYETVSDSFVFHKAIGKLYKLNSKWNTDNPTYAARGELGLIDGRIGNRNIFNDGSWQGYLESDIDMELDFGETISIHKVTMGFAQLMRYGILYPKQIELSTSADGVHYTLIKTELNTIEANTEERSTYNYLISFDGLSARYLKIVAKNSGLLPEWHYAKGKASWLFADEIMVE